MRIELGTSAKVVLEEANVFRTSGSALEQHLRGEKLAQSGGDAWRDVEAQIIRRPAHEDGVLVPALAEPLLVWITSGSAYVEERELDGDWHGRRVSEGDFFLTQADAPYMMRWRGEAETPFEVLHLYIGLPLLALAAEEIMGSGAIPRLRDVSGARDAVLSGLLTGLLSELTAGYPPSGNFVRGIAQSLAIHLVRHHAEAGPSARKTGEQLPAFRLRQAVSAMLTRLDQPFDLDEMAHAAGMSRFHFSRAFRNSMGQSPSVWFATQRILRAKQLLRETDRTILDISLQLGYGSPSHFAHVFRRETGVTPRDYRKS